MCRMRIVGFSVVLWGSFGATLCGTAQADLVYHVVQSHHSAWRGFGPEFDPYWEGETTVADIVLTEAPSYQGSLMVNVSPHGIMFSSVRRAASPFRVSNAHRAVMTDTHALADVEGASDPYRADSSDDRSSRSRSEGFTKSRAGFAQVVTRDRIVLSRATAVSELHSSIDSDGFFASGRTATDSLLEQSLVGESMAQGMANSLFEVTYDVSDRLPFRLDGTLAGMGDVEVALSLADVSGDTYIQEWNPTGVEQGGSQTSFRAIGVLDPGQYTFRVESIRKTRRLPGRA